MSVEQLAPLAGQNRADRSTPARLPAWSGGLLGGNGRGAVLAQPMGLTPASER